MHHIFSVTDLTFAIKKSLESRFAAFSVRGEITNFKEQTSGHLYFTLKDEQSQISAVLFKGKTYGLARKPKDGDQVVVTGDLTVYAPRGNYQIIVNELQFVGLGELLLKLHQLKATLEQRGWFDPRHKKPLPKMPRTIGVITSPTGSVIQDILNILKRRSWGFHLILNPVRVQGEGAAAEIAEAIRQFNEHKLADVLIVGRGGGSLEDLWAFNEEIVAKAIFESTIPIISAVGHETDHCIADLVADLRAPTPSAAAEIVTAEKKQQLDTLAQAHRRLHHTMLGSVREFKRKLEGVSRQPLLQRPLTLLARPCQQIDEMRERVDQSLKQQLIQRQLHLVAFQKQARALSPLSQLQQLREKFASSRRAIHQTLEQQLGQRLSKLSQLVSHLKAIDPKNLLKQGYCILFAEKKDSVIFSTKQLSPQQKIALLLSDGEVRATVDEIK
jgi:exodeoxyribonuclease VII large subunit